MLVSNFISVVFSSRLCQSFLIQFKPNLNYVPFWIFGDVTLSESWADPTSSVCFSFRGLKQETAQLTPAGDRRSTWRRLILRWEKTSLARRKHLHGYLLKKSEICQFFHLTEMLRDLLTCEPNPNFLSLTSQWIPESFLIHWFTSLMLSNMLMPFVKGIRNSATRQIFMLLAWITCLLCREKRQKRKRLLTDFAAGEQGRWNMAADCLEGFFFSRTRQKVVLLP